jgi:hypothetical protein
MDNGCLNGQVYNDLREGSKLRFLKIPHPSIVELHYGSS